jgi:hypothetical protein
MLECSPVTEEFLASPEGFCSMELFSSCLSAFPYLALVYLRTVLNKKFSHPPNETERYLSNVGTKLELGNILSFLCVLK